MSSPPEEARPTPDEVREALDRISTSRVFESSDRMIRFLRFVVERSLAGQAEDIKEYTLGVEVFDRSASFDPKLDTIVRVEARRLRRKLKEYYEGPGNGDGIRIEVPTPGYAPRFVTVTATAAQAEPFVSVPPEARRRPWFRPRVAIGMALLGVVVAGVLVWAYRFSRPPLSSVAVLPFENLGSDPAQDYFCDGFTEEVIGRLSTIENLRVIARSTSFEYKGRAADARETGRKLGVDALVEGSVRRAGETVRITAQLVQTADGSLRWSRSWTRQLKDVLAVQDEVSQAIAETFQLHLHPERRVSPNLEAYDLYLLGRFHWNKQTPSDFEKAIGYFQNAITLDPGFALAYSGLSETYSYLGDSEFAPEREIAPKAKAAADKALALNERLAEAHTSRGLVAMEGDWDPVAAEREFKRAIDLKPSFAYGIHWYAHFLDSRDKLDESEREMKRALAIDPLSRMIRIDVGMTEYKKHNYDVALTHFDRVREMEPDYFMLGLCYGAVYMAQGEFGKAVAVLRSSREKFGDEPPFVAMQGEAEGLAGDRTAALAEVNTLTARARSEFVPAYQFALIYYALGDRELGYSWLKRAFDDRSALLLFLKNTPLVEVVRSDPRAVELLQQLGNSQPGR